MPPITASANGASPPARAAGSRWLNWSLMALVNLMWAAQYPAYKVASEEIGPGALNLWSFAVSAALLGLFLLVGRMRDRAPARPAGPVARTDYVLLAALGLLPASVVLTWGIERSTASNGAILALTVPLMMVALGAWLLGERPARFYLLSLLAALAGTVLLSWQDVAAGRFTAANLAGNLLILAGSFGSAFFNVYAKRPLARIGEPQLLFRCYLVAVAGCALISIATDPLPFYAVGAWSLRAWAGVVVLGAFSWGLAMLIWMWLVARLEVGQVAASIYLLPVFGVALAAALLGERLTPLQAAGGLLVVTAVFFSSGREGGRA